MAPAAHSPMKMPRPQFRLRSLFILTAIVAVACLVGLWAIERYQRYQGEEAKREAMREWPVYKGGGRIVPVQAPLPTE
jgi:hypothetical protein